MPQAATQEGEASGSGSTRALRRGQTTTRSMALVRARQSPGSQSTQEPSVRSNSRKRKKGPAANQKPKKRKRAGEEEEVSSADSSPIREPHIPDEMYRLDDLDTSKAIQKARRYVSAKIARHMELPTLNVHMCRASMCVLDDPNLVPDRESARKAALNAGHSVLGLSSSVGGKPLARCCGFWVDWDEKTKIATALTTSSLICTKSASMDSWLGQEEYDIHAEVLVHMQGGTTEKATLQYHQKHYDLAFFSIRTDRPVHILSFNDGVKRSDQVFELARDERSFLTISHGVVTFLNPNLLERYHYMHVHSADTCPEVSYGSPAEKLGILVGDVINSFNGERISTTVELENMLLSKCEDENNSLNSEVNFKLGVFHIRKSLWSDRTLTVKVSDDGEVVATGVSYPFREGTP